MRCIQMLPKETHTELLTASHGTLSSFYSLLYTSHNQSSLPGYSLPAVSQQGEVESSYKLFQGLHTPFKKGFL